MSMEEAYMMSEIPAASKETPYQVQMFVSPEQPPACQNYGDHDKALRRVADLLASPVCPITGKPLKGINLAKRFDPVLLVEVKIKEGI